MRKALLLFFVFFFSLAYSQEESFSDVEDFSTYLENDYEDYTVRNDTLTYSKNTDISEERHFKNNLKTEYNDKDFEYIDNLKKQEQSKTDIDTSGADTFISFMSNIFPYLIGLIVVLIILKTFFNVNSDFWKFGKASKKETEKLVYEDHENIDDTDFEALLHKAIQNDNYRLATRYYYLNLLKKLSQKELIKYDKDKTNTEYQFELKNKELSTKFSYLAYLYDYVWYGEFPIDQVKFNVIENKYKSFIQII